MYQTTCRPRRRTSSAGQAFAWRWLRGIHNSAARTLAPSTVTATGLLGHQIENVWLWGRGVDTRRFEPAKRSHEIRARLAPGGELIAGYVGRLAAEKRVDLLSGITALEGVRLVIVGAGPTEAALRRQMPGAVFLGERRGEELAAIYASLDVFVHSGPYETFGQTLQEAAASGLPVVAPAAAARSTWWRTGDRIPGAAVGSGRVHRRGGPARRRPGDARGVRRGREARGPAPRLARADPGAAGALLRGARDSEASQGHDMRIVRLANFVAPHSGGLRTCLAELGAGYLAAGHEPVLVIPGEHDGDERCAQGRVITLRWTGVWARERGVPAVMVSHESVTALLGQLVVAGEGPLRPRLARRAARAGLPVTFAGFVPGRADLAALLASADVAIAPGPAETFGLAALEALACGTPVVVSAESALPEVVGAAGASVPGEDLAAGVRAVLARPEAARRAAARARAEQYDWDRATRGFLAAHGALDFRRAA